jgi:hypothetical protein
MPATSSADVDELRLGSGDPEPRILGPLSWLLVDSADYLDISQLQTLVFGDCAGLSGCV